MTDTDTKADETDEQELEQPRTVRRGHLTQTRATLRDGRVHVSEQGRMHSFDHGTRDHGPARRLWKGPLADARRLYEILDALFDPDSPHAVPTSEETEPVPDPDAPTGLWVTYTVRDDGRPGRFLAVDRTHAKAMESADKWWQAFYTGEKAKPGDYGGISNAPVARFDEWKAPEDMDGREWRADDE